MQWIFRVGALWAAISLTAGAQDAGPVQGNTGQASQPGAVTSGPGYGGGSSTYSAPSASPGTSASRSAKAAEPATLPDSSSDSARPNTDAADPKADTTPSGTKTPKADSNTADDNPYNPLTDVPPLPNGNTTLVGGTAAAIDQVRNRLTIQPFGGGQKMKMFLDERSHIYRNGAETTVLGIHKGDRVYADTMLDGGKIFARNVRVVTEPGSAEVRGQVVGTNTSKGTITLRDELSAQAVSFEVNSNTRYSAFKGSASSGDVKPGALIDVLFAPQRSRDIAQEIIVLAKLGDTYIFGGIVTHLDMRTGALAIENRSDEETYEIHFNPASLADREQLRVGSEVTAHATFDGKQYKADDLQVQKTSADDKAQ